MREPQNGWFIENPMKIDGNTHISGNHHLWPIPHVDVFSKTLYPDYPNIRPLMPHFQNRPISLHGLTFQAAAKSFLSSKKPKKAKVKKQGAK